MSQQTDKKPTVVRGSSSASHTRALVQRALQALARFVVASVTFLRTHLKAVAIATAVVLGGYGLVVLAGSDGVPDGTTVMGVDIGGLSQTEATARLDQAWQGRVSGTLGLDGIGQSTTMPMSAVTFDVKSTVADAATSRWWPGDLLPTYLGREGARTPEMTVAAPAVAAAIADLEQKAGNTLVEPSIRYEGTTPVAFNGHPGQHIDTGAATGSVLAAVMSGAHSTQLPSYEAQPQVNRYEVQRVMEKIAGPAVASPITIAVPDGKAEISRDDIAAVLSFQAEGPTLKPQVDGVSLAGRLGDSVPGLQAATPAVYEKVDGNPQVTPGTSGRGLDPIALGAAVVSVLGRDAGARTVTLPLVEVHPSVIPADLQARGTTDEISTFTQYFEPAEYRRINIGEAARRLNGTVVQPGEVFSMNNTVGERTSDNGYTEGLVVGDGGVLIKDLGGGVSTATTAVWTAAFFAGLEKVEQSAHSIFISRYTPGLEATVSWGYIDLKFRNNTDAPIYIAAAADDSSVTVSMYGKKKYDRIESRIGEKRNFTEPGYATGSGEKCVSGGGIKGFDVTVQRLFFQGGKQVEAQPFMTHYDPSPTVQCK